MRLRRKISKDRANIATVEQKLKSLYGDKDDYELLPLQKKERQNHCRDFLINTLNYLLKNLPHENHIIQDAKYLQFQLPEKVSLAFAQPITPDTTLSIKLKDVHRERFIIRTLMNRINVLKAGMEREVSLGVARIHTH